MSKKKNHYFHHVDDGLSESLCSSNRQLDNRETWKGDRDWDSSSCHREQ